MKNRIRIALTALGAVVFAVSLVSPASAYIKLTRTNAAGTGVVQSHWLDAGLPMRFISNSTNADVPAPAALGALQASAAAWTDINTSFFASTVTEFSSAPGESIPALNAGDGQNSIFFDTAGTNFAPGGTVIAFTRSIVDANDGHTIDADVVFNDRDFYSSMTSPALTPPPAGQSSVDLQAVMTHEFGHAYGLDHTSVGASTMIPFIIGDTSQRTLELDDQAGNSDIYPESAARGLSPGAVDFHATTGSITGTVVSGYNGSAIFGAHVEAINLADPSTANTISNISGELTLRNGQGDYSIHGLPPGNYAVRIVPLDGVHTIAGDPNVGGPFNGLDINFDVEFWNGANESGNGFSDLANDFAPVAVSAGSDAPGIAFITNTFPGQVTIAQYGAFENTVTFGNLGFFVKRVDLPFTPPYTLTKISFPSFTFNAQLGLPPFNAPFPSVRLLPRNPANGLPNFAAPLFVAAPFSGSPNGLNEIPINIPMSTTDDVVFVAIEFPSQTALPGFPANFPFLRMDFADLERGLFANDLRVTSAGAVSTLVDRNVAISLTAQMGSPELSPIVPVANLGANQRATKFEFSFSNPPNTRLDGFALPPNSVDHVDLVRRAPNGLLEKWGEAGTNGQISVRTDTIPAFPAGVQLWFTQAVDKAGHKSITSNTTITGFNVGADEPNGRANATEATLLPIPTVNRAENYSPAGDQDFYQVTATPGQVIQATAVSTGPDGANNQDLVMLVLDQNGDVLAFDDDGNGNLNPKVSFTVPPRGKSQAPRRFFIQVTDFRGSPLSPAGVPQVRIPSTYNLSVNVITPPPATASRFGGQVGADGFAFANTGPNPANPVVKLLYVLPQGTHNVRLSVFDVNGRLVRKLVDGPQASGAHTLLWDGTNDDGRHVSSGRYFGRIEAGSYKQNVGITILK